MKPSNQPPKSRISQQEADRAFNILQLWYREAYEESAKKNQRLQSEVSFWSARYHEMARSRDLLRQSNRVQQSRIYELEQTVHFKDAVIREIFQNFPSVEANYRVLLSDFDSGEDTEDTEEEDLLPTRRRLEF